MSAHRYRYNSENQKEYNKKIYRAMREYKIENFKFFVLEHGLDPEKIRDREKFYTEALNTVENGYNDTISGENHHNVKLDEFDVLEIRSRYKNKERRRSVFLDYSDKIGVSGFNKVWKGETWKHIKMEIYTDELREFHKNNVGSEGSFNHKSKIKESDVRRIRDARKSGEKIKDVYQDFSDLLAFGSFQNIWYGYGWKHVD